MAAAAGENWWRKMLAAGFLSFAALGLAGCDDSGTGGEEGTEQEAPAGGEETDAIEENATTQGEGPTEGEHPAEENHEEGER